MNNIKNTHIAGGVVLLIVAGLAIYFYAPTRQERPEITEGHTATTTQEKTATTTEGDTATETDVQTTSKTANTRPKLEVSVVNEPLPKIALGPRQKADSPASALKFFAEAMVAKDYARASSYFNSEAQAQYQASFEQDYKELQHPIVRAYYDGKVEEAQLVDPIDGLYEIAVYPLGSSLAYRPRFAYSASAGEFVILEL